MPPLNSLNSDAEVRNAQARSKAYKLSAGGSLYLEIMPSGARYWRWKYRYAGKEKRLALGVYPAVSLKQARAERDKARLLLATGSDPSLRKQVAKLRGRLEAERTFEVTAREWLALQKAKLAKSTFEKAVWTFEKLAFPWLGKIPMAAIEPADVLATLRRVEMRGRHETTHRLKQRIAQVFRYAIVIGICKTNPASELKDALAPVVSTKRAAVTDPAQIKQLMVAIGGYEGGLVVSTALKVAPYVFVRPGELRRAEWTEFDFDRAEWRIPAAKMKMREEHIVPLSSQVIELLASLRPLTGGSRYVFPSIRSSREPMSNNTINAALRRLGYDKETMTGHGFRALASTRLNEMGWAPDVIERQLAHSERNKVRAVYNRSAYLTQRRQMMQTWADYLDGLRI